MTILDLFFKVAKAKNFEDYDQPYEYWSIDQEDLFLFLTRRKEPLQGLLDAKKEVDFSWIIEDFFNRGESLNLDEGFIPYEKIEPYCKITVEIDSPVYYESCQKYPLVCIRGTCDKQCGSSTKNFQKATYCIREVPCTDNRPDWNTWTPKYPDFFNLLFDVTEFIQVCPHTDTLIVMFEYTPVAWESELNFNYSEALLVRSSNITIIGDSSKIEALYKEYNTKYPTKDRKIEETISEPEMGFYFKF